MRARLIPFLALLALGCRPDADSLRESLLAADREFARDAQTRRLDAWLEELGDSGVVLRAAGAVSQGGPAVRDRFAAAFADSAFTLNWEPLFAEVSRDGTVGYTVGVAQAGASRMSSGKYVTIWRKQADGRWRVALHAQVTD